MSKHDQTGIAVYAFTARGAALAAELAKAFAGRKRSVIYLSASAASGDVAASIPRDAASEFATTVPAKTFSDGADAAETVLFSSLNTLLGTTFGQYGAHIFIGATGIAVRGIAPFLKNKARDPAVLVLDQRARHVISLLSGHLGGANALCLEVARLTGADPVISTATDLENLPAIDLLAQEAGLHIANLEAVKAVSAAVLDGRPVWVDDPDNWLPQLRPPVFQRLNCPAGGSGRLQSVVPVAPGDTPFSPVSVPPHLPACPESAHLPLVRVSPFIMPTAPDILLLHPKSLWVGLGCKRGTSLERLRSALEQLLARFGLALPAVAGFASIMQKSDENGLLELAEGLALPLQFFSSGELAAVPTPSLSPKALELFGTPSVAEAAALLAARLPYQPPSQLPAPLPSQLSGQSLDAVPEQPARRLSSVPLDPAVASRVGEWRVAAELICLKQVFEGITLAVAKRSNRPGFL